MKGHFLTIKSERGFRYTSVSLRNFGQWRLDLMHTEIDRSVDPVIFQISPQASSISDCSWDVKVWTPCVVQLNACTPLDVHRHFCGLANKHQWKQSRKEKMGGKSKPLESPNTFSQVKRENNFRNGIKTSLNEYHRLFDKPFISRSCRWS